MKKTHYALGALVLALIVTAIIFVDPKRPSANEYPRTPSYAISANDSSALKDVIASKIVAHPGQTGFKLITTGKDSLLFRLAMIEAAQRSLDIQYYIIEDDMTGKLVLQALQTAADRGVRVRILMDDLNMRGSDTTWPLLNANPHIEIRIFNPFATRDEPLFTRISDVFTGLGQFSKRMHNKVMIADNQVAITGGRNVGDEYFDASSDFNFHDVDVLAVGEIVPHISKSFDQYWNNKESFPIAALHSLKADSKILSSFREHLQSHWQKKMQDDTITEPSPLTEQLKNDRIALLWANAELAEDNPSKIDLPKAATDSKPANRLDNIAANTHHEFMIVSPYFVPGDEGTQTLAALVKKGVKVKILTNSLASTDVIATYTGYRRYRKSLVEDGIDLYEMQPIPGVHEHSRRFSSASRSSLHSKIYVADRHDVVIGSFNLDPRSVSLNTEMVLVIHSPELAGQLNAMFEKATSPSRSFHLVIQNHQLEWIDSEDGKEHTYESEPDSSFWQKLKLDLFALLPFEDQL